MKGRASEGRDRWVRKGGKYHIRTYVQSDVLKSTDIHTECTWWYAPLN